MAVFDRITSLFGSSATSALPEHRLSANSEAALSSSVRTLVIGAKGWITLQDACRLFSPMNEARYAFGEMDDTGRSNLELFASRNHCKIDILPEGRVYFTRQV